MTRARRARSCIPYAGHAIRVTRDGAELRVGSLRYRCADVDEAAWLSDELRAAARAARAARRTVLGAALGAALAADG